MKRFLIQWIALTMFIVACEILMEQMGYQWESGRLRARAQFSSNLLESMTPQRETMPPLTVDIERKPDE